MASRTELLRDELADVLETRSSPVLQFHAVLRFFARELQDAATTRMPRISEIAGTAAPWRGRPDRGWQRCRRTGLLRAPCAPGCAGLPVVARVLVRQEEKPARPRRVLRRDALRDGPLKVIQARPVRLREQGTVMDDQIDDLLLRQAGIHAEAGERQIVAALALVLEVVALAEPRVPEPQVFLHPRVEQLLRDARSDVNHQRRVRETLRPFAPRLLLRFQIEDVGLIEKLLDVGQVVMAVRNCKRNDVLRVRRVLVVQRAGNAEHARQIREPVIRPAARRRIEAEHGVPPVHEARHVRALLVRPEDARLLEEPPGMHAVARCNQDGRRNRRRDDGERLLDVGWQRLIAVRFRTKIEVSAKSGDARDFVRRAAARGAKIRFGKAETRHTRPVRAPCARTPQLR